MGDAVPAVERVASTRLPTELGEFRCLAYTADSDDETHLALVCGDVEGADDVLVRVHSECLTGDVFASRRCDCGPQLHAAMEMIAAEGRGVVVYLCGHEGRGIGIAHKLQAYELQDRGLRHGRRQPRARAARGPAGVRHRRRHPARAGRAVASGC